MSALAMIEPMNPASVTELAATLRDGLGAGMSAPVAAYFLESAPVVMSRAAAALEAQAAEIARLTAECDDIVANLMVLLARNLVMDLGSAEDGVNALGGWDGVTKIMADRAALEEAL